MILWGTYQLADLNNDDVVELEELGAYLADFMSVTPGEIAWLFDLMAQASGSGDNSNVDFADLAASCEFMLNQYEGDGEGDNNGFVIGDEEDCMAIGMLMYMADGEFGNRDGLIELGEVLEGTARLQ